MARRFVVVGPGRVGTSLCLALGSVGFKCVTLVSHRKLHAKGLRLHFPAVQQVVSVRQIRDDFDFILLTVRDDEIRKTVGDLVRIASIDWHGKVALQTSGVIEVEALSKLRSKGASIGSLHPLSPFACKFAPKMAREIFYDFMGDKKALELANTIVHKLHSKVVVLKSEKDRTTLHTASVLLSNFTVIASVAAEQLIKEVVGTGSSRLLTKDLLANTVRNINSTEGIGALTGPLVRGDAEVIKKHLKVLENEPILLQFYKSAALLGIESLLKTRIKRTQASKLNSIRKILEGK